MKVQRKWDQVRSYDQQKHGRKMIQFDLTMSVLQKKRKNSKHWNDLEKWDD
jgi:hypothetical protein